MRILLISYYFPPFNSVSAVRPGKLASYLHQQGHDVHVLSCQDQPFPNGLPVELPTQQISYTPAWSINAPVEWLHGGRQKVAQQGFGGAASGRSLMRWLGQLYKTLLHWPDAQVGWVSQALHRGREILAAAPFDLIYVSAPPFSGFRVAARLSREFHVPWVAELRDLWTDNHAYGFPVWRRNIEKHWEARLLSTASALVTVSPPLVNQLQRFKLPVWEVRNGCDLEDFLNLTRPEDFVESIDTLNIVFTGNVYDENYDVAAFCSGLAQFIASGGKVRVHVAGRNIHTLQNTAQEYGLAGIFDIRSTTPRITALAMQYHADVLLTFLWRGGDGIYSAKLFEYVTAGRPILAIGQSDVGTLIEAAGLGKACPDAQSVAQQLRMLQQIKRSQGQLKTQPQPGYDFTRKKQFALLEQHLLELTTKRVR